MGGVWKCHRWLRRSHWVPGAEAEESHGNSCQELGVGGPAVTETRPVLSAFLSLTHWVISEWSA